jgi:hypothetical protein
MLKTLIEEFCKEFNIPKPSDNKEKIYPLQITDNVEILVEDKKKDIYVTSTLTPLPKNNLEELFILLMKANFIGQGTGKSAIGIDLQEKVLTLTCILPYESTYKDFKDAIEDYINYIVYWKKEIKEFIKKTEQQLY